MSAALARYGTRAVLRTASRARGYATVEVHPSAEWKAQQEALKHHAKDAAELWRKISFYVCLPGAVVCTAWVRNVENEHAEHEEHAKEENGGEMPEPPPYDYLNKRAKPFPWGPNSLFFNPHKNKDMSQVEEE